jgi:hypothetical protein
MIQEIFYINTDIDKALELTELAMDELESVVGRFANHSHRAGLLRGKLIVYPTGEIEIRKCFGNKLLWKKEV